MKKILKDNFNADIDLSADQDITSLVYGRKFNKKIDGKLPPNLVHLEFGDYYNQEVDLTKCRNLESVIFGWKFNKNIDEKLPVSVKYVEFGDYFDQDVNLLACVNLVGVKFGENFNRKIATKLPDSIKYIQFGEHFNKKADLTRYKNLKYVSCNVRDCWSNVILPESVESLQLWKIEKEDYLDFDLSGDKFNGIKYLELYPGEDTDDLAIDGNLPKNLTHLYLAEKWGAVIKNLPKALKVFVSDNEAEFANGVPDGVSCTNLENCKPLVITVLEESKNDNETGRSFHYYTCFDNQSKTSIRWRIWGDDFTLDSAKVDEELFDDIAATREIKYHYPNKDGQKDDDATSKNDNNEEKDKN